MVQYSLEQMKENYCFNETREELFSLLCEELGHLEEQTDAMKVLVFGSFITEADEPSDIDLIVSIIPCTEWTYSIMKNGIDRQYPDKIDIQYHRNQLFLDSAEKLVEKFNTNPLNKKQGIKVDECIELVI